MPSLLTQNIEIDDGLNQNIAIDPLKSWAWIRDFPRPDLEPNISLYPIQKRVKSSQNGGNYCQFLSSTFW